MVGKAILNRVFTKFGNIPPSLNMDYQRLMKENAFLNPKGEIINLPMNNLDYLSSHSPLLGEESKFVFMATDQS